MVSLMTFGVATSACGRSRCAALKWSLLTCAAPASPSRNASTRTYSAGFSRLLDHSNQRLPSSARVASVNGATSSGHRSVHSGFVSNFTTMKIITGSLPCAPYRHNRRFHYG